MSAQTRARRSADADAFSDDEGIVVVDVDSDREPVFAAEKGKGKGRAKEDKYQRNKKEKEVRKRGAADVAGPSASTDEVQTKRPKLTNEQIKWNYQGEDFTPHGPVATPAQLFGPLGALEPGVTPWVQLPPAIFIAQACGMAMVNDMERMVNLQADLNALHRADYQLRHPGAALPAMPATDSHADYINTAREEIRRLQIKQAEIRGKDSAPAGSKGQPHPTDASPAVIENAAPAVAHEDREVDLVAAAPPFPTHSSRISSNGFGRDAGP